MKSRILFSLLLAMMLLPAMCGMAEADSYHYNNILIGDRASGMGGAYTAVADDPSGIYYNPAGLVYSQGTNISASANAYHNTSTTYKAAIGQQDWKRTSSSLLPNFFGVVQKLGKGKLGLAYVVPDSVVEDQDQTIRYQPAAEQIDYTINFNNEDSTHLLGVAYAMESSDTFSWGVTLFYHHRRIQTTINEIRDYLSSNEEQWDSVYFESEEDGIRPVIGIMWTPADKYSFGASISKTFITGSRTHAQVSHIYTGDASPEVTLDLSPLSYDGGEQREYPLVVNLGGAYFASDTFMATGEANFYTGETDLLDGERQWVMNFALGLEKYTSPNVAIRVGMYTNLSSTPDIIEGGYNQQDHVDLYGFSTSYSHFGRGSSLTVGIAYASGSGDAQIIANELDIQEVDTHSTTIFLSNSYGF